MSSIGQKQSSDYQYQKMPDNAQLEVCTQNQNQQHQLFYKSEVEGVKDLRKNIQNSHQEEAWVFVEGQELSTGKTVELWYEVGTNETGESNSFERGQLDSITKDLERRGVQAQSWSHYHFHPKYSEVINQEGDIQLSKNHYTDSILSATDYEAAANMEAYRQKHLSDMPPLQTKVATAEGVWSVQLTRPMKFDEVTGVVEDPGYKRYINRPETTLFKSQQKSSYLCETKNKNCKANYKRMLRKLSNKYMDVDFQSYPPETALKEQVDTQLLLRNTSTI